MPENHWAHGSKERYILNLLGFPGINPFSKIAGVNHQTAGAVLGTLRPNNKTRPMQVAKVHQTLHSAFVDKRPELTKAELALILEWHKKWKRYILNEQLSVVSKGKIKQPDIYERRRVAKRHAALRDAMAVTLDALIWG